MGEDLIRILEEVSINISKLKNIVPEVLADNKNILKHDDESFRFTWAGKTQSKKEAHKLSTGKLIPCEEKSVDWSTTKNLYIEGDNLEVLRLLQKEYSNKIKMIYIDPPYNTGNNFIFNDNFKEDVKSYLHATGQIDKDGQKLSIDNLETDGRLHSNWLNMMYPRLFLARNLLTKDGVIFISIDDNEVANLTKLCNEIFGEANFISCSIRRTIIAGRHNSKTISRLHEYVLMYSKNPNVSFNKLDRTEEQNIETYRTEDKHVATRGKYDLNILSSSSINYSDRMNYAIKSPEGTDIWPGQGFHDKSRCWRWSIKKVKWGIENDFVVFKKVDGKYSVHTKTYEKVDFNNEPTIRSNPYSSLEFTKNQYTNYNGTRELKNIFKGNKYFNYPKSSAFIKELLKMGKTENAIVLDFFGGSSTTADAMLQLNAEDLGNRRFIMVQIPEKTDEDSLAFGANYKTITSIGIERIKRVGTNMVNKMDDDIKLLQDRKNKEDKKEILRLSTIKSKFDKGFKVYKLVDYENKE